jgi:hypothetical protein
MVGFDEFGGEDTFKTKTLDKALANRKIIRFCPTGKSGS